MKLSILLLAVALLFAVSASAQKMATYINVRDSIPKDGNIVAVLLKGKESNRVVGGSCPVLAQYIFQVGFVAADRRPWKTPQISHRRLRKLKVSYWYPLPAVLTGQ